MSDADIEKILKEIAFGSIEFKNLKTCKNFKFAEEEFSFKASLMAEQKMIVFGIAPIGGQPFEEILVGTNAFLN